MDKKMTSGEIAKKAGISQKAVRLYDEKGLLKPSEYSEGNYRLYDKEALLVLEKIIALKQIGFSLEEIHDNLIAEKNMDITESLQRQLELMEAKKYELERSIACIRRVLIQSNGQPDWNSVAELACMIQTDQEADEAHFDALKHTAETMDWYVKIYNSLQIQKDAKVLDLGCAYGKLWRNNWAEIPVGVMVQGVDLHGSWADDFEKYIEEQRAELSDGTDINILWSDVEEVETWNQLQANAPYTNVIAHYLLGFLKDRELLIQRAASLMVKGGMFSCNASENMDEHLFWKNILEELKLDSAFLSEILVKEKGQQDAFRIILEKYFPKVEKIGLSNNMSYKVSGELLERLCQIYPEKKKYFTDNEKKILAYFDQLIAERGEVLIVMDSEFWHCYK